METRVLVGGSSTGKTRACWEALELLPGDWRLWHPIDPSRPDAALADMERIGPRTVVWLNEAQHYLLTPAADVGERVAAGLRALLRDPSRGPVLVLGTIWPEYWAQLTTPPRADGQDRSDPHAQARQLLGGRELPVPVSFTDPEDVQGLRAAAAADPRLAHAAERAEEGQIAQYLAGGPALLERYHTAPAAARALVDAAIDARRLGLGPALPSALLEEAADGHLTATQWDLLPDDWFEEAMAHVARGVRGARGALTGTSPPRRTGPRPAPLPARRLPRAARPTGSGLPRPAGLPVDGGDRSRPGSRPRRTGRAGTAAWPAPDLLRPVPRPGNRRAYQSAGRNHRLPVGHGPHGRGAGLVPVRGRRGPHGGRRQYRPSAGQLAGLL
ncbi:hypothetical protein SGFS_098730 [Streptomyces graminofaciens]|uniref:Uncharacterized protein n=1 Tax=Streptomyces graminofaciens TaxID=68212 RepID=A0ABN5VYV4_9ACTN|nr:hypothetical protein SGFS_098730 [Streptomyces graminofaciens]